MSVGGSKVPVITSLKDLRVWRQERRDKKQKVGVVPTMGALHQGHLDLVKSSLQRHPFTIMTLFVNPMQFAPTEDLSKYPRTLQNDLNLLSTLLPPSTPSVPNSSISDAEAEAVEAELKSNKSGDMDVEHPLVVFAPPTDEMYPLRGELQDLKSHRGVGVEMRGWGDVMEGSSRPRSETQLIKAQFFKGVATVCTKLFNAVEPDHAYFGQKDIQQALLLKMMVNDLLLSHPSADTLHILPTTRDPTTKLALSSRNAYLSDSELKVAPILYKALSQAKECWSKGSVRGEEVLATAVRIVVEEQDRLEELSSDVVLRLDYFELFEKNTFEPVRGVVEDGQELVIAGAIWVGGTRLIDNLLIGWEVS